MLNVIKASRRRFARGPRRETRRVWRECELSAGRTEVKEEGGKISILFSLFLTTRDAAEKTRLEEEFERQKEKAFANAL